MNILVSERGEAKLADFDHSISVDHTEYEILGPATERWGAPETFLRAEDGHDHTITPLFQNDTWSFGCVWWEVRNHSSDLYDSLELICVKVYSGQRMYTHEDAVSLLIEVSFSVAIRTRGMKPGLRPHRHDMTEGMWNMVQQCWDLIPAQRPSWDDILSVM
jgi:serine/threonine protein kinase